MKSTVISRYFLMTLLSWHPESLNS